MQLCNVPLRVFSGRQHNAIARFMLSPVRPSVRPFVCHTGGWISRKRLELGSCNFALHCIEYPHDSSFLTVNFIAKFQRELRERGAE